MQVVLQRESANEGPAFALPGNGIFKPLLTIQTVNSEAGFHFTNLNGCEMLKISAERILISAQNKRRLKRCRERFSFANPACVLVRGHSAWGRCSGCCSHEISVSTISHLSSLFIAPQQARHLAPRRMLANMAAAHVEALGEHAHTRGRHAAPGCFKLIKKQLKSSDFSLV